MDLIRCENCQYKEENSDQCELLNIYVKDTDFCSRAEKKLKKKLKKEERKDGNQG